MQRGKAAQAVVAFPNPGPEIYRWFLADVAERGLERVRLEEDFPGCHRPLRNLG